MPIYEYECLKCGRHHEIMQKIKDLPLATCPSCGGSLKKMISNTSFVLKGTGWYATDYASGGNTSGSKEKSAAGSAKAEGKQSGSKTESTKETKSEKKETALTK